MKSELKRKIYVQVNNIVNKMWSVRFLTILIILFVFMDLYLSGFREDVKLMGENCNWGVLPFVQTSSYFMKLALLCIVYFYSNVPFMEKEELFFFIRLGRKKWGRRNLYYLIVSSLILTLCFVFISIIQILPVSHLSATWGEVYKTFALTGGQNLQFAVPYGVIDTYPPLVLMLITIGIDWLAFLFIGLLMYVVSLAGHRLVSCIIAAIAVFLPLLDARMGGTLVYYSPLSWVDCGNWRIGFNNNKPDLPYIYVALIFLDFILSIISQYQVRRMEWNTQDD